MTNQKFSRRLAAIFAADIAGYSRLMGEDDVATVRDLKGHQAVVLPLVAEFGGRVIDTAGDGILAEFQSAVAAVECATQIQKRMARRNAHVVAHRRMQFRIGINLGEVIHDESRIYGDDINIAARLENIAQPGGICVSAKIRDEIEGKLNLSFVDLGAQALKNIAKPVQAYALALPVDAMSDLRRFGHIEIRPETRQLVIEGQVKPLGARAFDVLLALVDRRDRVVPKSELLELVWPGMVVEESRLQVQVSALRMLLGSAAIATIPGQGYHFTLASEDAIADDSAVDAKVVRGAAMTNLLADADILIGRSTEVDALHALLRRHRAITIIGPSGIGKSRLAGALAARNLSYFPHGVWWVDLAALAKGDRVVLAIAHAAGVPLGDGDGVTQLAQALAPLGLLLVLDNCEHLVPSVTAVLQPLLAAAPDVRIVVTSQVALYLPGEEVWRLDPLALPPLDATLEQAREFGALALFERRAQSTDQRFALNQPALTQAIDLCRHLDGNALAIELAAAWAPRIGIRALNERLTHRLRLLHRGSSTVSVRHQSLRATLDWSSSLLTDAERAVLWRLGVFTGSFGLDAAQRVASGDAIDEWAALDALSALVDRSLLHVERLDPPRYRMLETTRLYAYEQLVATGEAEVVMLRHGHAMVELAQNIRDDYRILSYPPFVDLHAADYSDMDAAFERACARHDASVGAMTGMALAYLDDALGASAARRERMVAVSALLPSAKNALDRAMLLKQAAAHLFLANPAMPRLQVARELVEAWRVIGDQREMYMALAALAGEWILAGDLPEADGAAAQTVALEEPAWPRRLRNVGEWMKIDIAIETGDLQSARERILNMLTLAESTGDERDALRARLGLADVSVVIGDFGDAIDRLGSVGAEVQREPTTFGSVLTTLCAAHLMAGDYESARDAAVRALPILRPNLLAGILFNHLALLAVRGGDAAAAGQLLGHADRWYTINQISRRPVIEALSMELAIAAIDKAIGRTERTRLRREGENLDDHQADALARRVLSGRVPSEPR